MTTVTDYHTDESRHVANAPTLRFHPDGKRTTLIGRAIVFGILSQDLGGFKEIIAPSAIDRTLKEQIDVRAFVDHDPGKPIGRLGAGTLRLRPHRQGVDVEIDPPQTTAGRDIVESIGRGDVTGMSFAFRVMPNGDTWTLRGDTPVRTVTDMRVREVSVVALPAYEATNVELGLRSLADFRARNEALVRLAFHEAPTQRPLAELMAKQRVVEASIRQATVNEEIRSERETLVTASARAWRLAEAMASGGELPKDGTADDVVMALRLKRLGYTSGQRPLWVLDERQRRVNIQGGGRS